MARPRIGGGQLESEIWRSIQEAVVEASEGGPHVHPISDVLDLQDALDAKQVAGSYASDVHNHDASYEPKNANIQAHVAQAHAPSNAQKNSDITKAEIEAKLTGEIESHTHPAGAGGVTLAEVIDTLYPVGALYTSTLTTNPGTLLGRGTWAAFGAGRVMVGHNAGDADFDTSEKTGGAKTVTLTAAQSGLPQHTHVQNAHTHVQDAHSHIITSQTATTGGATSYEHGTLDTSSAEAEATETTATAVAVNQNATAVNQNAGPADAAQAHSNVQPYITVFMWKRTA